MNKPTYNLQCSGVHVVHTDILESILGGGTNAGRVNGSTTTDTSSSWSKAEWAAFLDPLLK